MQGGQGQDWGYLVPKDILDERYDDVKVLESPGKSQISGKRGQRGGSARVGDQCMSDLSTGEIKPRHQIRSNGLEVRKV